MPKQGKVGLGPLWEYDHEQRVSLYQGHVLTVLGALPSSSVHCVVTSPPYWGLRDYGGDKAVEIGSEQTPQEYIANMVTVFREVRRVLRDDGTCWLNLGDSYGEGGNLVGMPWRVVLALQEDGWILRQDIIWAKPAPMPESVTSRCTKAHEYVFLLAKKVGYYYDHVAIKEQAKGGGLFNKPTGAYSGRNDVDEGGDTTPVMASNKRSVWSVSGASFKGAHFATFPPQLIAPMIKAGTSAHGACGRCGSPWRRVTESSKVKRSRPNTHVKRLKDNGTNGNTYDQTNAGADVRTVGWAAGCGCEYGPLTQPLVACTVLDPFVGSGTTCAVSTVLGRSSVGIDLNAEYLSRYAVARVTEALRFGTVGSYRKGAAPYHPSEDD